MSSTYQPAEESLLHSEENLAPPPPLTPTIKHTRIVYKADPPNRHMSFCKEQSNWLNCKLLPIIATIGKDTKVRHMIEFVTHNYSVDNVTDLLNLDIKDGENTWTLTPQTKDSVPICSKLHPQAPKLTCFRAAQQSPTMFLAEVLQTRKIAKKVRQATRPEARVRIDIFVSLHNSKQRMDTTKMPRTCITQFSLNWSSNAFRNLEFYKLVVKDARTHLVLAAPFPVYSQVETPTDSRVPLPDVQICQDGNDLLHIEVASIRNRNRIVAGTTQVCWGTHYLSTFVCRLRICVQTKVHLHKD